jgi:predicted amidohydrolase YtcJ
MNYKWVLSLLCLLVSHAFAQSPDLILTNGKIFTADVGRLYVQALAIKGNVITAIGTNAEIEKLAVAKTNRIDLKGKTVVPGFNSAHEHLGFHAPVGLQYTLPELTVDGPTKAAILDSITQLVKKARPNQWIQGPIGITVLYDTTVRNALDRIAPYNPVMLQVWTGHGMILNKKGLEMSGLSDLSTDPVGGWYDRVESSNKICAVHENAQAPAWGMWAVSEPENLIKGLRDYAQQQIAAGITSVQVMGSNINGPHVYRIFKEANLPYRVRVIAWPRSTSKGRQLSEWKIKNMNPSPWVKISGIKYMIDGTPLEGNALMKKPYPNKPDWYGKLSIPTDTLRKILLETLNGGPQLMMHIVGDSSFTVVLSLMKEMANNSQWSRKRVRMEHNGGGILSAEQIKSLKELGVLMMHTPKYGSEAMLRSLLEMGVSLGISPDGTTNPFLDILRITTAMSNPNENITREQAVIAFTKTNSYAEFEENRKGTLTPGKLADLAILSQDIFLVPSEQLAATYSEITMVDGKIVYRH